MKYKLIISYDGTKYSGWQVQPNALSIQALIQNGLKTLLHIPTPLISSGRTDAGVHAYGQVAHFLTNKNLNPSRFLRSLNDILPLDIRIREIAPVPDSFHARFSAKAKIYFYRMHLVSIHNPLYSLYSTHIHTPIDLTLMKKALSSFVGTHDFSSFAGAGCGSKNPYKTLYRLEMISEAEGIRLEFEGDGFLYKMVRNIVGTVLEIAKKKLSIHAIPHIFAQKNRCLAGPTAPSKGLFLYKVFY